MAEPAENLEPQTALIRIEEINVPSVFGDGKVQPLLDLIRAQVADVTTDASTPEGRAEIKSAAYKVARSKTLLDDAGKNYATELRKKLDGINGHRRKIRDELDTLKDTVRKPLTEWEEAERKRAEDIAAGISRLLTAGQTTGTDSASIAAVLAEVKATEITDEAFDDRKGEAAIAKDVAVSNLERALAAAKKREDEAAELERLRREKEEREQREAEERRTREAEERARKEAEDDARARVEQAERAAREAQEAAARAEREANERAERAEREAQARIDAERRERERKEQAEREAEEKRRQDREHRRTINSAAADALREWSDLTADQAQTVVTLIAAGRIPAVTINY